MKIVCLDGYTENPGDLSWEAFEALGEFTTYDRTPSELIDERIGDAPLVLTNKTPLTAETIRKHPTLKYIGVLATGYNVVDVAAAKECGVVVTNIPTYGTDAVAQFAMALLLEICHNIGLHAQLVKEGAWERSEDFCFWKTPLIELAGKTMGIIGFGRIGQAVGRLAQAFKMNVLAYDTHTDPALESETLHYASLDEIYRSADVISLHCPLFSSTQGMINKESIAKMKDGVIILNNSRGPLIVEKDLRDALNKGKVAAAGVDVVSTEPIHGDNPLLQAKNIFITPHISWAAKESRARLMQTAADNLKQFLAGDPVNVVNP